MIHPQLAICTAPMPLGNCPTPGHGKLIHSGNRASAHYIVGLSQDRENPAQPYVDIAELVDSAFTTWHGQIVNTNSIGIEHANVGNDWNAARYDAMEAPTDASDFFHLPHQTDQRPADYNRWYHCDTIFPGATSNLNFRSDLQAYQEEQYLGNDPAPALFVYKTSHCPPILGRHYCGKNAALVEFWSGWRTPSLSSRKASLCVFGEFSPI